MTASTAQTIDDFTVASANGSAVPLAEYRGQVLLIVNVASKCGFTPQYAGLESLHRAYAPRGFSVLGFPCNQFGHQEPGDAAEIANFCATTYDVTFPIFAKIDVNGADATALYTWLKDQKPGLLGSKAIKWNFTKFLIGRDGKVLERAAPNEAPEQLRPRIEAALGATGSPDARRPIP
jgi:glutathione peroxidase